MSRKSELENLVRVKKALSEKYFRLARTRKSIPGKKTAVYHAELFRRDADAIAKLLK